MIHSEQLRELIIRPTLTNINLNSKNAEELLVFTAACESLGGYYLKQVNGPALGLYQMEPATHYDIWNNFLRYNQKILDVIIMNIGVSRMPLAERMIYDLQYATIMARIHYRRVKEPLPDANNVEAMWEYYKQYYNTHLGKATKDASIKKYEKYLKNK